jgi:DNA polymerase elongation subunit (family B)
MEHIFKISYVNHYNAPNPISCDDDDNMNKNKDNNVFIVQLFGKDEHCNLYSVIVEGFKPFFYVMVNDKWNIQMKRDFVKHLKEKMGYYSDSLLEAKLVSKRKLYGFDNKKKHKFIYLEFANTKAFNKAKNFWYTDYQSGHKLLKNGYQFSNTNIKLYEANIPPILRFFHTRDISTSGWVAIPHKKAIQMTKVLNHDGKHNYTMIVNMKNIIPLNDKETRVPFKIMSFDIEASSSHGDFPIPIKTYKKLAINIIEYFEKVGIEQYNKSTIQPVLIDIILTSFGYKHLPHIDLVYPKKQLTEEQVITIAHKWLSEQVRNLKKSSDFDDADTLEAMFEQISKEKEEHTNNEYDNSETNQENDRIMSDINYSNHYGNYNKQKYVKQYTDKKATIIDILLDKKYEREGKINELNISLVSLFPKLEGDKVTFIGSTFMNYGDKEPYLNHCIVLNTCSNLPIENSEIETYNNEKDVLLAWKRLVQKQDPDYIIGYNIFGFDYEFMFRRSQENNCVEEFLELSRNPDEYCGTKDEDDKWKIEESTIQIASGQHDLKYIKMNGRNQVDLYNYYRKNENLTSYKLDYVAGYFIGDIVKSVEYNENHTIIKTGNLTGLLPGSYIHIEEIGHSVNYYEDGAKYLVTNVDKVEKKFEVKGMLEPDFTKIVRWSLAKDDVTPKDIFQLANGTKYDRAIIAKYCIQDCNLVHYLFNKSDILTEYIEMSKICCVPIEFLVMRGQGIKLQSVIGQECRKIQTLIPVIDKGDPDEAYEGAIVLPPKCGLYMEDPVACNDYASLYPSSMISENISHDSKVWTKEYDLDGNLIEEIGEKDENGNYIYDNLPEYEYVDIPYDTYKYVRKNPKAAPEKMKIGHKLCRYVQPIDDESAIMPAILKKFLKARKDTRKLIPKQTDEFMKQVLDKRQLAYKVTANSLYGGCGAKTSSFYEKDIAACTTSMGRKLLTYGKRIIEECYADRVCQTKKHGLVMTKAEYIYGDTDSVFYTFNLHTMDGVPIKGKDALEITIELANEVGDISAKFLKGPHDFEYEKTFMPFCLLSKKRYVGMLYETDINKCKRKEMGIVLKRRDNAPIVKDVYGGIIDILMKQQSVPDAISFLQNCLQDIVDEKYPIEKLIITKSLRSGYKNPNSIAHKVLADRITARDPGNKPAPGDRIPFVYINAPNKNVLQGEKIETPTFILENKIKIDYSFYITNQIMKPVQQLFALVLEDIWKTKKKLGQFAPYKTKVNSLRKEYIDDDTKFQEKVEDYRCKEIKKLLFDHYLRQTNNSKEGNQSILKFIKC